jgi:tetratricopeptide (TPR) repeat protein
LNTVLWDLPNSDETLALLGDIFLLQGEMNKAQQHFKQALDINPGNLQALFPIVEKALNDKQFDYAQELVQKALARLPNQLTLMGKLVQIKMLMEDWQGAEQVLKAMEKQPKAIHLTQFLQGKIYQQQGECNRAISKFQTVLQQQPGHGDSLREMARCYEMLGQRPKMLQYLDSSLEKYPKNTAAIVLKSKLLTLDKKFADAMRLLQQNLEQLPSVPVYSELARVYIADNKASEAIKTYTDGLQKNPDNIELSMLLASVYIKEKNYDEAVAVYDAVLEKNPQLDIARNNLAALLLDHYGKEADIQKASSLVKRFKLYDQPYFLDTYAWALFKSGQTDEARTVLEKIIVAAPDVPVFRFHLAQVYQASGNVAGAVSELRQTLALAEKTNFDQLSSATGLLQELQQKTKAKN